MDEWKYEILQRNEWLEIMLKEYVKSLQIQTATVWFLERLVYCLFSICEGSHSTRSRYGWSVSHRWSVGTLWAHQFSGGTALKTVTIEAVAWDKWAHSFKIFTPVETLFVLNRVLIPNWMKCLDSIYFVHWKGSHWTLQDIFVYT